MTRILIVDDESLVVLTTSMMLEEEGFEVECATSARAGETKALETQPDLILTDYMMPRMTGLELVARLRAQGMETPIVLATSVLEDQLPVIEGARYDAYVPKPFTAEQLVRCVTALLNGVADSGSGDAETTT